MSDKPEMPTYGQELVEKGLSVNIEATSDNVIAEAEKIANNSQYNHQYKHETIQETLENGLELIDIVISTAEERLNKQIGNLRNLGGFQTSPPPEEIAGIQYQLSVLRDQWENKRTHLIDSPAILQQWEIAIQSGDRVTARVMKDYAAPVIKNFARTNRELLASLILRTEDMYLTDENKAARAKLEEYEQHLQAVQNEARKARMRLQQTKYQNGSLIDSGGIRLNNSNL